jgi:hypothetical protein
MLHVDKILLVDYFKFDSFQASQILFIRDILKSEEIKADNQNKKIFKKIANTRSITVANSHNKNISSIDFTTQTAFDKYLRENGFFGLLKVNDHNGILKEIVEYEFLENGSCYLGIFKKSDGGTFDPAREIKHILNSVRSRIDFAAARALSKKYCHEVKFVQHEFKLYKSNFREDAGNVDSLFSSICTDYLLERKRTVNESVILQVQTTHKAYKDYLKSQGISKNVISIVYAESFDEVIARKLLAAGIHVMQDSIESRFFDEESKRYFTFLSFLDQYES